MNESTLRNVIRELITQQLQEVSTSDGAGAYNTPFAFRGNSKANKNKAHTIARQAGYSEVEKQKKADDSTGQALPIIKPRVKMGEDIEINEHRYHAFKAEEGTVAQKVGKAIRNVNAQLESLSHTLKMAQQLKTESCTNTDDMWKSTARALTKLESQLNTIATRVRNLKS